MTSDTVFYFFMAVAVGMFTTNLCLMQIWNVLSRIEKQLKDKVEPVDKGGQS